MTAGLHDAATRHLTGALALRRLPMPFEDDDRDVLAVEVFLGIGAIDAEEAGEWRARFKRAGEAVAEPDPTVRRRAIAHLRQLEVADEDVVVAADALVAGRAITPAEA
ncbi:MAG TPA: hypothetical protein VJT75_16655, partial [Thermoleophilaceae bacterium]|nr:hypothetical protein [Thermoleophilaceae bacterium]